MGGVGESALLERLSREIAAGNRDTMARLDAIKADLSRVSAGLRTLTQARQGGAQ